MLVTVFPVTLLWRTADELRTVHTPSHMSAVTDSRLQTTGDVALITMHRRYC